VGGSGDSKKRSTSALDLAALCVWQSILRFSWIDSQIFVDSSVTEAHWRLSLVAADRRERAEC